MNRNELITKIQNLINEAHLSSIPKIYYEDLFDEVEKLRQPINLADFLAWEEGVEYEYRNTPCKIENNKLFYKSNKCSSGWCNFLFYNDEIEELQQAKKVKKKAYHVTKEEPKYYAKIKGWELLVEKDDIYWIHSKKSK